MCVFVGRYIYIYVCPRHRITRLLSAATLLLYVYYNMMSKQCVASQVPRKPYPDSSPSPFRFRSSHPSFCRTGSCPVYVVISPRDRAPDGYIYYYICIAYSSLVLIFANFRPPQKLRHDFVLFESWDYVVGKEGGTVVIRLHTVSELFKFAFRANFIMKNQRRNFSNNILYKI